MTAICGGGTSSPQPGVGGVLTLGATAIEVFIASVLLLPELAPVVAPIIAGLVDISIASYCGTDPPSDPGLTLTDISNAIAIPPSPATFTAQQRILQWFESRYWYQVCQCNSVSTPTPPTPSNPGTITNNPGLPNQSTPCWDVTVPFTAVPADSLNSGWTDLGGVGLPVGSVRLVNVAFAGHPPQLLHSTPMPTGATRLAISVTLNEAVVSGTGHVVFESEPWNSTGAPLGTDQLLVTYTSTGISSGAQYTAPTLASGEVTRTLAVGNDDTITHTGTVEFSFFCPPGTPTPTQCCPPDPLLEGELQQILQYVQAIYAGLPIPPHSFSEGTVHSSLTGNGSVTFSGVPIALKVDLTTIPSWVGIEVGNPNFYFDVGYLSFGTSEGNYAQSRLELQHQVVTVPVLAGSVGYTLKNGVVATITELLPGP